MDGSHRAKIGWAAVITGMATDYQAWPQLPVERAGAIGAGCRRAVTAALLVAAGAVIGFTAAIGFSQPVHAVRRASPALSVAELMALSDDQGLGKAWHPPLPVKRCAWVIGKMTKKVRAPLHSRQARPAH